MLKNLWDWWIDGLTAPWPDSMRRWFLGHRRRIWVDVAEQGVQFTAPDSSASLWRGTDAKKVPASIQRRLRASDMVIRLPGDSVLKRSVTIPPEVSPLTYIRQRLDELSPFPGDRTCFDIAEVNGGPGDILVMANRTEVDKHIDRLRDAGLRARAVTVEGFEHTPLDLLPVDRKPPARRDAMGAVMLTAGLASCAAVAAVPFVEQSHVLDELNGKKAALERTLIRGTDTRQEMDRLRARAMAINEYRASRPGMVDLLAEVTSAMPDHSWVRQLVVHGGEVTLQGESADTADLIARLEASARLHNVRYDTAITRDAGSGKDRFNLKAETRRGGS